MLAVTPSVRHPTAEGAPKKLYLLVHDSDELNQVIQYEVSGTGELTASPDGALNTLNTSAICTGDCQTMAYSARRKLLFTSGGSGISVTNLANPVPALVAGSPFGGARTTGIAVVEKGRNTFVYGSNIEGQEIYGFRLTPEKTLVPLPGSPFATGVGPAGVSAVRDLLYVSLEDTNAIGAYRVAANGSLKPAPNSPYALPKGSNTYNVDVDPLGRFVYVADCANPRVFGYRIVPRTAALRPLAGSPFAANTGLGGCGGLAFASPRLLFAIAYNDVATYVQALSKTGSGALSPLGKAQGLLGADPDTGAVDPTGSIYATVDDGNDSIRTFGINRQSGHLTLADEVTQSVGHGTAVLFVKR